MSDFSEEENNEEYESENDYVQDEISIENDNLQQDEKFSRKIDIE